MNPSWLDRFLSRLDRWATNKNTLWLLFAAAVVTRLIGWHMGGTRAEDDDHWHVQLAENFLNGRGFRLDTEFGPTYSYIQPGFAFIHVVFMTLFTDYIFAERILLLLFSSATIIAFFFLAKRLFNPGCALVGTVWLIFYPPQWFWMTRLNPHSFATNILVMCFLLLYIAWDKRSAWFAFAVGLAWGALTQMRPEYELGIACLAFASFLHFRGSRLRWIFPAALMAGWAIFMAPWVIRNYRIHGRPVVSTTHYGINLWYVFNPNYTFAATNPEVPAELFRQLQNEPNEVKRADLYIAEAKKNMQGNPLFVLRQLTGNFLTYWRPWLSPKVSSLLENVVYTSSYVPLFLMFLLGLRFMPWKDPHWIAIYLFMLYKMLAHLPFYLIVRFREATMPIMLLIACLPLFALWQKRYVRASRR